MISVFPSYFADPTCYAYSPGNFMGTHGYATIPCIPDVDTPAGIVADYIEDNIYVGVDWTAGCPIEYHGVLDKYLVTQVANTIREWGSTPVTVRIC